MLVMMVGFMAIALVVVYRLSTMSTDASDAFALDAIALPAGAELISAQAQDGLLTVTYRAGDTQALRIFNGETGEIVSDIAVVAE